VCGPDPRPHADPTRLPDPKDRFMPQRRRLLALLAAAALVPTLPPQGARAQGQSPVSDPIRVFIAALLGVMKSGKATPFEQRVGALGPAIDRAFDLDALLRGAVGPRWADLAPADQEALRAEFRRFTVATWVANFDSFDGQSFTLTDAPRALPDGGQVVDTRLTNPNGGGVTLSYVMRDVGGNWRAVDILADGSISRVAVLRSDFRQLLTKGGAPALLARLREKTAALAAG